MSFAYHPVTIDRWPDLERLFAASAGEALGNPSRCWCMEWRMNDHDSWSQRARAGGEENRLGMEAFIASGEVPGILAYEGAEPVGWCSVSPRATLVGMHRAGVFRSPLRPDVWSLVCFYVPETHRGLGLMRGLVAAATRYAVDRGAAIVEGYPMVANAPLDDGAGGIVPAFERAGFVEVARPSVYQRVMRYVVATEQQRS
jgi:GNAT superfamily N-acetyltransferase